MIITIAMLIGVIGVNVFLVPNQITTGGIVGIASIVYWGTGIPVQNTYFLLNALLLIAALAVLGWRFCAKTIYAVIVFTVASTLFQHIFGMNIHALSDQKFMACIVGGVFMGTSVGLGLSAGGSTGGSDIIAAIVHKYRDVSLGRIILLCDMTIITSSYVVLRSWEKVLYGYVLLFIVSFVWTMSSTHCGRACSSSSSLTSIRRLARPSTRSRTAAAPRSTATASTPRRTSRSSSVLPSAASRV